MEFLNFFGALGDKFEKNVIKYAVLISCISSFISFYFDNLNHFIFSSFLLELELVE